MKLGNMYKWRRLWWRESFYNKCHIKCYLLSIRFLSLSAERSGEAKLPTPAPYLLKGLELFLRRALQRQNQGKNCRCGMYVSALLKVTTLSHQVHKVKNLVWFSVFPIKFGYHITDDFFK